MNEDRVRTLDVVVVGGGIAGMSTANRAAQLGLSALVLESGTAEKYFCNSRFTGGTFHLCRQDIMSGEDALRGYLESETKGTASPEIIDALAKDAPKIINWLRDEGIRFMKASGSAYHNWVLAPPGRSRPGLDWEGRAGDVLLMTLEKNLGKRGGCVERGVRARSLVVADGRVAGVVADTAGGERTYAARAVVLADGGFQGSASLVREYVTPHPERLRQRGAGTGIGDGLLMAMEAGAAVSDLSRFYGHLLSIDALTNDNLWPYPYLDAVVAAGIAIGPDGRRFADEGRGGVFMANAVAALPDPLSAAVVFDAAIWEKAGRAGLIPVNPHLVKEGGTLHSAGTLAELAAKLGVDSETFGATVEGFNRALAAGGLGGLTPPRSGALAQPIAAPPFYAAPVCAGLTYTMGGILTDGHARVLRKDGGIVDGLYAVGATTGGLEGGPAVGYVGGLAKSAIFGLRAAEDIAGAPARATE
jgi:fumarate reductase flavoprotein subunit